MSVFEDLDEAAFTALAPAVPKVKPDVKLSFVTFKPTTPTKLQISFKSEVLAEIGGPRFDIGWNAQKRLLLVKAKDQGPFEAASAPRGRTQLLRMALPPGILADLGDRRDGGARQAAARRRAAHAIRRAGPRFGPPRAQQLGLAPDRRPRTAAAGASDRRAGLLGMERVMTRLDDRRCLYGEVRLSDPQVIALRAAAAGTLRRTAQGWFADQVGARPVSSATVSHLERKLLIEISVTPGTRGKGSATGRGEKILAAIDEAATS